MDAAGNKIYAVDFDGTLSQGVPFPEVGTPNKPLIDFLLREKAAGARIILYTCRTERDLKAAVVFCQENGLYFDAINENLPEMIALYGGDTRKINADYYIDDKNMYFPTVKRSDYVPDDEEEASQIIAYNEERARAYAEYLASLEKPEE